MKNSTKRALLMSVLSMFLCFTMLVGTTFAWFTDTVESGKNQIVAGNLDVELDYWNGTDYVTVEDATDLFDPNALWEPGHAEVAYLRIANKGNLAFKYRLALSVLGLIEGKTKDGEVIDLSKYLNFGIVNHVEVTASAGAFASREAAISAVGEAHAFSEVLGPSADAHGWTKKESTILANGADQYFAIVVWMPTSVGNEANHDGVNVPSINLGVTVFATQLENESDSFGTDYDKDADVPAMGSGITTVVPGAVAHPVEVRDTNGSKIASGLIPAAATDPNASEVGLKVTETAVNPNVTISTGNEARTFDVEPIGVKADNQELIKVKIRIDAGLDPATVKLYHYDQEIACDYNPYDGYVTFETATFSPFTVVYEAESEYVPPVALPENAPKATVTYYPDWVGADIEWGNFGGFAPTEGLEATIDAAFVFECPAEVDEAYKNWLCDFYVSLDEDLGANEIFLGGQYGSYLVGFHNGELTLEKDTELPLLGAAISGEIDGITNWTYADVESFVGTFTCGVGNVGNSLEGATFTVALRLINPENTSEYYDVNVVTYTFGGAYNIQ